MEVGLEALGAKLLGGDAAKAREVRSGGRLVIRVGWCNGGRRTGGGEPVRVPCLPCSAHTNPLLASLQVNDLRSDVAVLQQSIAAARGTYDRIKAINQEVGGVGWEGGRSRGEKLIY